MTKQETDELWALFNRKWLADVHRPKYDAQAKADWQRLEKLIQAAVNGNSPVGAADPLEAQPQFWSYEQDQRAEVIRFDMPDHPCVVCGGLVTASVIHQCQVPTA